MDEKLNILKGIHPGFELERILKKRKIAKGRFALSIGEFPQTLSAVTKGKRNMNTALALRIERELGLEEGYMMTLQVFYDIKEEKSRQHREHKPELSRLRRSLFWDTRMENIDWEQQKRAVIRRVFERGTRAEKEEITRFYGAGAVEQILHDDSIKTFDHAR
jgi:plasmid maintenance system antidote protein VapI